MEDRGVLPMKIVSQYREQARRVDYGAVLEPKTGIPAYATCLAPAPALASWVSASLSKTANSSQPEGTINGTVLDEDGQPFKGVQVCTWMRDAPAGSRESRGDYPVVTTDQAGQFRIDHVAMGATGVEAIKPEDGYVAFAGTSVREVVTLTPDQRSATVVLKLGPKAGRLIPSVTDKFTGKPVIDFEVSWTIFDSDSPTSCSSGGQAIRQGIRGAIVPSEKYLVLAISASGYKKWFYCDPSDPSRPAFIRLQPGEEKELLVELEPQAPETR
jgi:hypothetical protein